MRKIFLPNASESLKDAQESHDAIQSLSDGVKLPMLADFTGLRSMDPDARAYYSGSQVGTLLTACAAITSSRIGRVISNFFIGFNKPPTPVKFFNNEEEAVEWLKQFK